jgi:phosphoribosylformylglycinamidine cyclo-ligase
VIYAPAMHELVTKVPVHAFAHVTGGGITGNLARVLPEHCDAVVHRGSWEEPKVFEEIQGAGAVPTDEMEHVFNLGIGMVAAVPPDSVSHAIDAARAAGHDTWPIGEIVDGRGRALLVHD